jgi:hypothetical protein
MSEYNATASATLMILAEDLEPETVTKAIHLFPSRSWRAGETPDIRNQNGEAITTERAAERGCWKAFIPVHLEKEPLERQLEHWILQLEPRRAALAELAALGWEIVIDCYFGTSNTELLELHAPMLKVFGELGVSLDIHFFAGATSGVHTPAV